MDLNTGETLISVLQSRLLKSDRDKDKTLTKEEIEAEFGEKTWMVLHKYVFLEVYRKHVHLGGNIHDHFMLSAIK